MESEASFAEKNVGILIFDIFIDFERLNLLDIFAKLTIRFLLIHLSRERNEMMPHGAPRRTTPSLINNTLPLITQIVEQSDDLPAAEDVVQARTAAVSHLKEIESQKIEDIKQGQDVHTKRALEQLSAPGASSWLGALPLESHGFNLTKGEFQDALALRYNKPVKNLPEKCPCDEPYTVTHALNCHGGGCVNARHDNIKHFECGLLKSVVRDIECEPMLQPVVNRNGYKKSAILTADARLDIRARGFWRDGQNAFFDVRVTNADAESQENQTIKSVLKKHEGEKKLAYNRRIWKSSMAPSHH